MAKTLEIKIYPNTILREKSKDLAAEEIKSAKIQQLILDMEKTMKDNNGIGLAAVQVGELVNLILVNTKDGSLPLINPKITHWSWKKEVSEEGCLSIPNTYGQVKRSVKVKIKALDSKAQPLNFSAEGLFARVIQHEVDHTNGVLFIDLTKEITKVDSEKNGKEKI